MSATQAVDSGPRSTFRLTFLYGLIILVSAFLLFQVQPLITKIILPWFGGVAAVWTASLLFFQMVLLAGYFYAHVLTTRFSPATQGRIHAGLAAASLLTLPVLPRNSLRPAGPEAPLWHILAILALAVGLPYFVLSATSPLLQCWYAREKTDVVPYRFYALSNLGSMLALLSYPVLVEPFVASVHQAVGWSIGYAAIALVCAGLALTVSRSRKFAMTGSLADRTPQPSRKTQILWLALAACGSALLLAVTNHISQDIAPVPFLWVIPLALYLLSFILCFERRAWYKRDLFLRLLAVALGGMAYGLDPSFSVLPMKVLIPVYCIGLWICCMFCHGELARLKPDGRHLTRFYLTSSLGGAIGAIFVALVAPAIFSGYYELPCALGFCATLVLVTQFRDPSRTFQGPFWHPAKLVLAGLVAALVGSLAVSIAETKKQATRSMRNFYGVLRVVDHIGVNADSPPDAAMPQEPAGQGERVKVPAVHIPMYLSPNQTVYRQLLNGTTDHGLQFLSPSLRRRPTSYYSEKSGAGIALKAIQQRGALQVGLVGLGAGTLAAYGRTGDHYTFYEINPLDVEIAKDEFTFLGDSSATIRIVPGDARLSLEREPAEQYDALVLDAFSSDSIPAHLLTREAFGLYFRRLKSDGVLALHISNQYLDLQPVVEAAARDIGKEAILVSNEDDHPQGIYAASWILMGSPQGFYGQKEMEAAGAILHPRLNDRPWTDDYSSLFRILK